jgi:hypothetical protein
LSPIPELEGTHPIDGIITSEHNQNIAYICTTNNYLKKDTIISTVSTVSTVETFPTTF